MTADTDAPPGTSAPRLTAADKAFFTERGWVLAGSQEVGHAACRHCRGTGVEASQEIRREWLPLIRQLREAGHQRAVYSNARNEHLNDYYAAMDEIRQLTLDAQALGIPMKVIAAAVGVTPGMMYNYLSGNIGGKKIRAAHSGT